MEKRPLSDEAEVQALFREKPFLANFISSQKVLSVKLCLAGCNLLTMQGDGRDRSQRFGKEFGSRIFLIDDNGCLIVEVGRKDVVKRGFFGGRRKKVLFIDENVGEAINRVSVEARDRIVYALVIEFVSHYETDIKKTLILFKAPAGMNLLQIIEADIKNAQAELNQMIGAIDKQAKV